MRKVENGALAEEQWLSSPRLRLQLYRRRRWVQRRREVPCWLASLFLHLLAVIVLGSIVVPISRHARFAEMLLSFSSGDAGSASSPPAVLIASETAAETNDVKPPDAFDAPTVSPPPVDLATPAETDSRSRSANEIGVASFNLDAPVAAVAAEPPGIQPKPETPPLSEPEIARKLAEQARNDAIVERFIAYDIGRLPGEAGQQAKRDFDRLSYAAIPSLVRGLNRAAQIHASCPVMVISNKLDQALRDNHDPAMLSYALDHLGEGVPSNAPHYDRLQTLFDNWRGAAPNALRPVAVQTVLQTLQSRRLDARLKAAASLLENSGQLREPDKPVVAWIMIHWLTSKNPKLREAGHRGLVALTDGIDLGPEHPGNSDEQQAAACRWSMHFDAERFEAAAQSTLKTARHLAETGHRDAAMRYYRKLAREYEGTTAAAHADALRPVGHLSRK